MEDSEGLDGHFALVSVSGRSGQNLFNLDLSLWRGDCCTKTVIFNDETRLYAIDRMVAY